MKKPTKDITTVAIMTALLICTQFALSMIAGVEVVTVLFVAFTICYGRAKGVMTAVAFSLLRCIVFGSIFSVILLYLIYFTLVALLFGSLKNTWVCKFPFVIIPAILTTVLFTMTDNLIAPIVYSIPFKPYFLASIPVMLTQMVNVAITFAILFLPLKKAFELTQKL